MSQENVEVVRRTLTVFNRDGIEATLENFDGEVEWIGPPEWPDDRTYKGHDGIRRLAAAWGENFDEYRVDPDRLIDAGDRVVALANQRGRIKGSAVPIAQEVGVIWTVRDAMIVHVEAYFSWSEVLEAAGLSE
jgi:ketosteroid isomerase-like protein